jgi:glycosyltransferase involved in cell wall biosynthesis
MNICQVMLSDGWGGAEAWVHELIKCLLIRGENVSLIVNQDIINRYTDLTGVTLLNAGPLYPPASVIPHLKTGEIKNSLLRNALSLFYLYTDEPARYRHYGRMREPIRRFLADEGAQVIHSHSPQASILIAQLSGLEIPVIAAEHGEHVLRGMAYIHPLARPLIIWRGKKFARALSEADRVTVSGRFMANELTRWRLPLKNEPVVIPTGIDIAGLKHSGELPFFKLEGGFNILFPGGPKWTKGGDLLVAALAGVKPKMPDFHLYIALEVPPGHLLRKMVRKLGLAENVTFTGFLPPPEYRRLLKSVDLFVLPSRIEAFATTIFEAMAVGKPIVAANTGGFPDQLENGRNGLLTALDPAEIGQAILRLYMDDGLRRQMSENNLADITRFDSLRVIDLYISFYRDMMNEKRRECVSLSAG